MLVAMCGLPGAGKSALADDLGRHTGWGVYSVDPVEAALLRVGAGPDQVRGLAAYVVVEAVAEHQLTLGQTVIIDAVNDVPQARQQWYDLAERSGVECRFVQVVCSDLAVHRQRLESRRRGLGSFPEPLWASLGERGERLSEWTGERLVVDSLAERHQNLQATLAYLGR